jgi:AraC family transcriptional regulator
MYAPGMGADGRPVRTLRTQLATVGAYALPAGYAMREHLHPGAGLVLGLAGSWIGALAVGREHACEAGAIVVLPDGAGHRERSPAGSRCLLVTFEPGRRDLDGATLALLARDRVLPGAARRFARRLAAGLARGAARDVDELVVALIVALGGERRRRGGDGGWLRRVREALDEAPLDGIDLAALAGIAGRSREHVFRSFRAALGVSPGAYARARRLERAARLLVAGRRPVAAIAAECGFADESHLARWFRARFGAAPGRFRRDRGS